MLLHLPAQLGHILPAAGAARLVQFLEVALGLRALRGVLRRCKLPAHMPAMTLLEPRDAQQEGLEGARTAIVLRLALLRYRSRRTSECMFREEYKGWQWPVQLSRSFPTLPTTVTALADRPLSTSASNGGPNPSRPVNFSQTSRPGCRGYRGRHLTATGRTRGGNGAHFI